MLIGVGPSVYPIISVLLLSIWALRDDRHPGGAVHTTQLLIGDISPWRRVPSSASLTQLSLSPIVRLSPSGTPTLTPAPLSLPGGCVSVGFVHVEERTSGETHHQLLRGMGGLFRVVLLPLAGNAPLLMSFLSNMHLG